MKIVRVLLFLVLLAGEYQLQSSTTEAHCTLLVAANRQNLLCATNVLFLDKRMTIVGTLLASTMMISLKTERRSCDLGMPIHIIRHYGWKCGTTTFSGELCKSYWHHPCAHVYPGDKLLQQKKKRQQQKTKVKNIFDRESKLLIVEFTQNSAQSHVHSWNGTHDTLNCWMEKGESKSVL